MEELRKAVRSALDRMEAANAALQTPAEDADLEALQREFDEAEGEHRSAVERLERSERVAEARANAPVEAVQETPEDAPEVRVGREPLTYEKHDARVSFFRDLMASENHDSRAKERIARHMQEMETEKRTNPNSTDGQGGEFVPPLWMQNEWLALAKASRPFADACRSVPLPQGTDSINLPTVATGATTATQADAGAVSSTDITTSSYSVGVKTIAGQQDFSLQLLDRSIPGFDVVVYEELQGRYAINIDTQCLAGSGSGANAQGIQTLSGTNSVTYTDASPTVPELYPKIADAIQQIHTGRFLPPSAIVMHPRRWAWVLASLDSSNRPLVVPNGDAFNQAAVLSRVAPESVVGGMHGLPIIVDANITTTNGASTNEDIIYVARLEDLWLLEDSPVKTRVLREVLSNTLQVRIQLYNYFAFAAGRYPKSISKISGTGLTAPTF
jgi:HK97 family phage major capsid protein